MSMERLELFTDGGATKIRKRYMGAAAYVIKFRGKYFVATDPVKEGTNNHYELKAIRDGLKTVTTNWRDLSNIEIWIVSDSQYAISCVTEWFHGWELKKGKYYNKMGKEISNIELILEIRKLLEKIPQYRFVKVRSHIGVEIEQTWVEFNRVNHLNLTFQEYLCLIHFNDICDKSIANAINYTRREIAKSVGRDLIE